MFEKLAYILSITLSLASFQANAQIRKYSNEFLQIGVGARSLAMGGASVASSNDATSAYWNPANLADMEEESNISLMHASYFAGIANYDYAGYAHRGEKGTIALTAIRFGIDDIQNTLNLVGPDGSVSYDRITRFSTADYAFLISYARKLDNEHWQVGGNAKVIYRQVGDFANAYGFGLDAGVRYNHNDWVFAGSAKDITTTFNTWTYNLTEDEKDIFLSTGNEIPEDGLEQTAPSLAIGISRTFDLSENLSLTPETDFQMWFDGQRSTVIQSDHFNLSPVVGLEFAYADLVYLRLGGSNFTMIPAKIGDYSTLSVEASAGLGVRLGDLFGLGTLRLDYAFTDVVQSTVAYSNVFSLHFDF